MMASVETVDCGEGASGNSETQRMEETGSQQESKVGIVKLEGGQTQRPLPLRPSSPDSVCSICLDSISNCAYAGTCLHKFCFHCLLEWSKVKPECPLCKKTFINIFHNVRSIQDYDQMPVPRPPSPNFVEDIFIHMMSFNRPRFAYRTTQTGSSGSSHSNNNNNNNNNSSSEFRLVIRPMFPSNITSPLSEDITWENRSNNGSSSASGLSFPTIQPVSPIHEDSTASGSNFSPGLTIAADWRRRRQLSAIEFRRQIYRHDQWVQPSSRLPLRERMSGPSFYRNNPAQLHRLVPWLNRELNILLDVRYDTSNICVRMLAALTEFPIRSARFTRVVWPYLGSRTHHFIHELYYFAISPYDMMVYDLHAEYARVVTTIDSADGSSTSNTDIVTGPNEPGGELTGVLPGARPHTIRWNGSPIPADVPLNFDARLASVVSTAPTYMNPGYAEMLFPFSNLDPTEEVETIVITDTEEINDDSDSSSVIIINTVPPPALRSPIVLSSSESSCEELIRTTVCSKRTTESTRNKQDHLRQKSNSLLSARRWCDNSNTNQLPVNGVHSTESSTSFAPKVNSLDSSDGSDIVSNKRKLILNCDDKASSVTEIKRSRIDQSHKQKGSSSHSSHKRKHKTTSASPKPSGCSRRAESPTPSTSKGHTRLRPLYTPYYKEESSSYSDSDCYQRSSKLHGKSKLKKRRKYLSRSKRNSVHSIAKKLRNDSCHSDSSDGEYANKHKSSHSRKQSKMIKKKYVCSSSSSSESPVALRKSKLKSIVRRVFSGSEG